MSHQGFVAIPVGCAVFAGGGEAAGCDRRIRGLLVCAGAVKRGGTIAAESSSDAAGAAIGVGSLSVRSST